MPIYINEELLETFKFPGGECHFNISKYDFSKPVKITAYLYSSDDIMCLFLLEDAMIRIMKTNPHELIIPYFPYARQDRVCNKGEPFSLEVAAKLIRDVCYSFTKVTVIDPHSQITRGLLPFYTQTVDIADIIYDNELSELIKNKNLLLVAPDKGAANKVKDVHRTLSHKFRGLEYLIANKVRDPATGKILSTEVEGDIERKNLIIIDDICDGGRTFTELAKVLKAKGAKDLYLYVTHGIFSNGFFVLKEYFKHIYCYHTFLKIGTYDQSYLTILKKGP
jgi:ribose-phosphate pyrophosphokinase